VPSDLLGFKYGACRPSFADTKQFLIKLPVSMKLEQTYIVIDAFDECLEGERPDTICLLIEIMAHLPCA
jgi:hypothetical protein